MSYNLFKRKNWHSCGRNVFTKQVTKLSVVIAEEYHCYQLHTKFYPIFFRSRLTPVVEEITGDYQCGFLHNKAASDKIICIRQIRAKEWEKMGQNVSHLKTSRRL
jgi:hypothetical protein